jgi:tRNA(fMet)-specific endonuclease VapC
MNFLIDTNICSAYLKGETVVWNKFMQYSGGLAISVVTAGELWTWVARKSSSEKSRRAVLDFLDAVDVLDVDLTVALRFGDLRGTLLENGTPIPDMDGLIAATALVGNLTLVTQNLSDFKSVPALRLENWMV